MVGLLFSGCSSGGGDEPPGPESGTDQPEENTEAPPTEPTQPTEPTGDSGQQNNGGTDGSSGGNGGFNTAGRVSGNFTGIWPSGQGTLTNPTNETYTGTASFSDCTPGPGRWSTTSPDVPVSLSPGGSQDVSFSFTEDTSAPYVAQHVLCVRLTGRSTPITQTIPAPPPTSPAPDEVTPDESAPEAS